MLPIFIIIFAIFRLDLVVLDGSWALFFSGRNSHLKILNNLKLFSAVLLLLILLFVEK